MSRSRLTKSIIDKVGYKGDGNSRCVLWDDEIRGLGLRIYPSGAKSFVLSYRHEGRKRMMTVGDYGVLTLDQARAKARKALGNLDEADPLAERERVRRGETVGDLAREYLERHAKAKKRSWKDDERRLNQHILKPWGARKVASIDYETVSQLYRQIGKAKPIEENRTLALLSKMFALAQRCGMFPHDKQDPAKGHDRYAETKRDRWVTPAELPKLAAAIDAEPNQSARIGLWLYMLTGVRRSELLVSKWSDVDITRKVLRLPMTKAGRSHEVPLSAPALALLEKIPRVDENPYILVGKRKGAHLVNISKPWGRVRRAAGVEDVRLHDLRRTVGSWLVQAGNSLSLIGKVLNHSNLSTTLVYARMGQDQTRDALEQMGERMLGAAGVTTKAAVSPIAAAKKSGKRR